MTLSNVETTKTESPKLEPQIPVDIVKVIRTLLTSAKNGLLPEEIIDDYQQMEGKQIPFKALGYNNLEDLLRDTNQFSFIETKEGIKVMSKPSKDAYVNRSIPNSPSRGKKKGNMIIPPQRALRPTTDNHWNGTAYSQAYTQMPNRSVKKAFTHPAKLLQAAYCNSGSGGTYRPILKQSNISKQQVPKDEISTNDKMVWNNPTNQSQPFPMRAIINQQTYAPSNPWNQRNSLNKKPIDGLPSSTSSRSSVQSRLAIQKTISSDTVDFAQPQYTPPPIEPEFAPFQQSNGGIVEKVGNTIYLLVLSF